jgi:dTDP-4-dehydrorhamnose reductase
VRLLVTGGTGYVGAAVRRHAQQAGWTVVGTTRAASPAAGLVTMDLADEQSVRAAVEAAAPDAVVHTAYAKDDAVVADVVGEGSARVARACAGLRQVHVSSDVVFGGALGRPLTEDDRPDPLSAYGRAKLRAERALHEVDPTALAVRTSLVVGGVGPSGLVAPDGVQERSARAGGTFWADCLRSPVQLDDLALALVHLVSPAGRGVFGVLHAGGADHLSRADLAELLGGRPVARGPAPPGVPLDTRLDSSRAASLLPVRLRGVHEVRAAGSRLPD